MRKPILALKLATSLNYMTWFRHHGKPYPLSEDERIRQHCHRRPIRPLMNPRSGVHASMESSSTPTPHMAPVVAPPSSQY
ncbi:hypothetical protein Golob_009443, partial [Gossypium lobatum]|nr:hypothetical protein [Gossypium lobatum]